MRRLLLLVSAIVLVDTIFFSALSPLLPHFTKEFGLSKTDAGILTAAYAAGGITAALPAGLFASRVGVKPAVLLGLVLMIGTTVAFGLAQSGWVLDTARFGQGFASAFSWNGALAWLIAASPRDRRGELIGVAMGAAVGGALLGPVVGAVAALRHLPMLPVRRSRSGRSCRPCGSRGSRGASGSSCSRRSSSAPTGSSCRFGSARSGSERSRSARPGF
ncbi:MAG: MFS transporter [Actinobacteria bacterium]|nr:MAG: MFS transporter [Actinomycetota bacterium]